MASVEGFSVKGAGSVVSLDGSRWETSSSLPFFFFFFLSPSSSESLSVGSTTERSRSLPFEDQVPMLHFRLCFDGLSGTLRLLLAVVAPPASLWYDGGSWDVGDPSSLKWTDELVVSVGEPGARAPWLEGERWLGSFAGCWLTGVCGELLTGSGDCGPSRSVVTICGGEGIVAARNELDALGGGEREGWKRRELGGENGEKVRRMGVSSVSEKVEEGVSDDDSWCVEGYRCKMEWSFGTVMALELDTPTVARCGAVRESRVQQQQYW